MAGRNTKREYLLRGYIKCRRCGRNYVGVTHRSSSGSKTWEYSYYRCGGRDTLTPARCGNQRYRAEYLDQVVWQQIEALLANPELVMAEIQRKQESKEDTGVLEKHLDRVNAQLASREKQKARIWKAFELTGDEETFKRSIGQLQREVEALGQERTRLGGAIEADKQFKPDVADIKRACEVVQQNLKGLGLEDKRMATEALQVRV